MRKFTNNLGKEFTTLIFCTIFMLGVFSSCGDKDCSPDQIGSALKTILADDMEFIYTINTLTCSFPSENILRLETDEEIDKYINTFKEIFDQIKPVNKESQDIKNTYETFISCFKNIKRVNKRLDNYEQREGSESIQKKIERTQKHKDKIFKEFNESFTPKLYEAKGQYYKELQFRTRRKLAEYCHVSIIDLSNKQIATVAKTVYPIWEEQKNKKIKTTSSNLTCLNKAETFYETFIKELITTFSHKN